VSNDSPSCPSGQTTSPPTRRVADPLPCKLISWAEVYRLSRQLASHIREAGFRPEIIVAIARGGVIPARILCDFFSVYDLLTLRVAHYVKGAQAKASAQIVSTLSGDIAGQRILLVDDVSDTGDTLRLAFEYLKKAQPARLRTAVLHHKRTANYIPDFHGIELMQWNWLIYPWAVLEDLSGFIEQMQERPSNLMDLARRLQSDYGIDVGPETLVDVRTFLGIE
jgi:hypoxanthine phosphoribosyltransferase